MAKDKLETFKIGDTQKPGVRQTSKKQDEVRPSGESQSLGFRRIEGILEQEDPASISQSLNRLHAALEELEKSTKTNKDKAAAKKALVAVERTADLMDFLFQTKDVLASQTPPR